MTIKELIKILETYPEDCEVVIAEEVYGELIIMERDLIFDPSSNKLFIEGSVLL